MCAEHNKDEEAIYYAAVAKSPAERAAYLKKACGNDADLLARVEALLKAHDVEDSFLETPVFDAEVTLDDSPLTEGPGTVIGHYKLLEKIGEGGMAVVYMAEQKKPIRRKVALKIIKLGMDTRQVIARFETERQALAIMDHPNIAKVLDAGATETGRPYFVMELVRGVSITDYCDKNKLSTRERLDLFTPVCNAVQHAHQKGIIHRDIKPSNVMVTLHDGKPVPKVIDFGIAKATNQQLTEKTVFTRYAQMIGTPAYMSPEQAEMSGLDVDTRTDIYSLGVLLYELLTAATPFSEEELRKAGYLEMQRIIREEEPVKPSTKLSTLGDTLTDVAEHRKTEPSLLTKLVRGDLDWIVMKTLEKDRTRRYDTATELAADIARHLNHEPVQAAAPSALYKVRKFVRRHRVGVVLGSVITLFGLVAILTLSMSTWMISREQARTQKALEGERQAVQDAQEAQAAEATAREAAERQKKEALRQRDSAYHNQYVAQIRLAPHYWEAGQIVTLKEMLEEYIPKPGQPDLRGWEWYYLLSLCHKDLLTLRGHNYPVRSVAWSPDGQRIASGGYDTARVWDAASGKELMALSGHSGGGVVVAWSPDGKYIATGSGDKAVRLWDATTGEEFSVLRGHTGGVSFIAWSPDGSRIASGSRDKTAKIWDAKTGKELLTLPGHAEGLSSVVWSSDGKHLATGTDNGWVKIWEVSTGQEIISWRTHRPGLWTVAWSPDSARLATGGYDQHLKVWDTKTAQEILTISHDASVESVAWSPDGRYIASATRSQRVRVWDSNTGQEVRSFRGHTGWVNSVAWSPDSKRLTSGGDDHMVKVWDACADQRTLTLDHTEARKVAWSPKGDLLASAGGGEVKIWDPGTGHESRSWHTQPEDGQWVTWSSNGKWLASGYWHEMERTIKIWDVETGKEMATAPVGSRTNWSPDSRFLAIASGKTIKIWDLSIGQTVRILHGHTGKVWAVSWSPDGHWLATAAWDGLVKTWDTATGKNLLTFRGHSLGKWIASVTWSPDGKRLASGGWDQEVKVWDVGMGSELFSLRGHTGRIVSVVWSPDGNRLASSSSDATAKVWDAYTGQELLTLRGHQEEVRSVAWSYDGKRIATASEDGTIKVWNASEGYKIVSSTVYRQDRARRHFSQGRRLARDQQYHEACEAFGKAIELDPNLSLAYRERGRIYSSLRRYDKAIIDFARAVELDPNDAAVWGWLGLAPCNLKNLDAARVRAIAPIPFDGGNCVIASDTKLYWVPGKDAVGHKVHFGADPNTLLLLRAVEEINYVQPPKLERFQWYCWRVDSVKSDGSVTKGNLWSFSTGDMVAWWKFDHSEDNTVFDSSGNELHGKLVGDARVVSDEMRGNVISLDGDGDWVDCENDQRFNLVGAITISAWIKVKNFDRKWQTIVSKGDHAWRLSRDRTTENVQFGRGWGTEVEIVRGTVKVNDSRWHHVTGVYNGKEMYLYVDSVLDNSVSASAIINIDNEPVLIGENFEEPGRHWNGLIDDVRIYSYALSEEEIKELYAGRGPGPIEKPKWITDVNGDEDNSSVSEKDQGLERVKQ